MSGLPEPLLADIANRAAARANAAAEVYGALTERERGLVKDAAVMGYVQGLMRTREEGMPKDSQIVQLVVQECLAFPDLYPTLSGWEPSDDDA